MSSDTQSLPGSSQWPGACHRPLQRGGRYSGHVFIPGGDKAISVAAVKVDETDKNEAKEASRGLVGQSLECQASGWISVTGEKSKNRKRLPRS